MIIESLSGVRAHDKELTEVFVKGYAVAFAEQISARRIVIARDTRASGENIKKLMIEALVQAGRKVIDIGICPTPTTQFATHFHQADGGIMITASHNPLPWNGIKFINRDGLFLDAAEMELLQAARKEADIVAKADPQGEVAVYEKAIEDHIRSILFLPYLKPEKIRERKFKVVIDAVNGAGFKALPDLLEELGCEVVKIYCESDKPFPHTPEPLPENLKDLTQKVRETGADIGLAVDPDADRLALVNEKGENVSEEYTLVLATKLVLSKCISPRKIIVTNLSTTMALDDVVKPFHGEVIRTAIGEINVAKRMAKENALIGGEGNGGVILPDSHLGRDSLVGAALILQLLLEEGKPLSQILAGIPKYENVKAKADRGNIDINASVEELKALATPKKVDTTDGLKFIFDKKWVHMRPSNTEPIIRIYAEAPTKKEAQDLAQPFIDFFNKK